MIDKNRKHRRIEKPITIQFCLLEDSPKKWDMSILDNISVGGVSFTASSDLKLNDKIIQLQIRIPELAPIVLELEAMVVNVRPRLNEKQSDVGAKFINLSEINKEHLSVVEKMIDLEEIKNASKAAGKKI